MSIVCIYFIFIVILVHHVKLMKMRNFDLATSWKNTCFSMIFFFFISVNIHLFSRNVGMTLVLVDYNNPELNGEHLKCAHKNLFIIVKKCCWFNLKKGSNLVALKF